MFGTFRFNDSLNEAEYVELSRDSGVDARGYTLLVSRDDPPAYTTATRWLTRHHHITGMQALPCPQGKSRPAPTVTPPRPTGTRVGPPTLTPSYSSSAAAIVAGVAGAWPRPKNAPTVQMAIATGIVARPAGAD